MIRNSIAIACAIVILHAQQGGSSDLSNAMLQAHNAVRVKVGVPPLTWSETLAKHAQEWADTLLARGQFDHRPKNSYGENLYRITRATASPDQAVGSWASEAKDYDYRANSCRTGAVCGHYTQLVWRDTKQVGCGVARGGGREVWVCNYKPRGNWVGERPY